MGVQEYFWMDCWGWFWMKLGNETFHRYSRDQSRRVALARLLMKNSILILHPNRITMVKMVVILMQYPQVDPRPSRHKGHAMKRKDSSSNLELMYTV